MFNDIIEIGICVLDVQKLERVVKRSILVKPTNSEISLFCTELTSITKEMIDFVRISFPDALEILRKEFKIKERAWVSWGVYDRLQFQRQCEREELANPLCPTHSNAKNLFAIKHKLNKEIGMEGALKMLNLSLVGIHQKGVDDAWNIARIFQEFIK